VYVCCVDWTRQLGPRSAVSSQR